MSPSRRALASTAALALLVVTPVSAQAQGPYDRGHYDDHFSFTATDFCGIEVNVDVHASGSYVVRTVKGSDGQAFFAHDTFTVTETISTEAGFITTERRGNFLEQKATHVEGDIWEFQFLDAGTFRVYDSGGDLLLRAAGVFKASEQFDTFGDSQPGGAPVDDTFEIIREPGKSFSDEEFCAAVLPELT